MIFFRIVLSQGKHFSNKKKRAGDEGCLLRIIGCEVPPHGGHRIVTGAGQSGKGGLKQRRLRAPFVGQADERNFPRQRAEQLRHFRNILVGNGGENQAGALRTSTVTLEKLCRSAAGVTWISR